MKDERWDDIMQSVTRLLKHKGAELPTHGDPLNQLQQALQVLEEKEATVQTILPSTNERINAILNAIIAIANLDYSAVAPVEGSGDIFDALAGGINMLSEELQASTVSLREKEVLLKEVHHRVKNNLQVISSLLSLQASTINDPLVLEKFIDSQKRVKSMALVHEKLYESGDLNTIDFKEYIESLVESLHASFDVRSCSIELVLAININNRLFNIDTAIPCGLIINELLANCFKYAFEGRTNGKLLLSLHQEVEDPYDYVLVVEDDGVGMPEHVDPHTTETLGLQLIYSLADQLDGVVELHRQPGTRFTIKFQSIRKGG